MKKIVALMLVLVMALSVCACAGVETNGFPMHLRFTRQLFLIVTTTSYGLVSMN